MKFTIKNVGTIESATIELGDFTIVCGANNTGKTYITYLVYGFITLEMDQLDTLQVLIIRWGVKVKMNSMKVELLRRLIR